MNRPAPVKPDNLFVLLLNALRRLRVPIGVRIVSHSLLLVVAVMLTFAWVFNLQGREVIRQQSEAVGESLKYQAVASASELLASNDLLSLKVMLDNLVGNPLVAHAAIYGIDNRLVAEAGRRPPPGLFERSEGVFSAPITHQEVAAGRLQLSLDMAAFQRPLHVSLQNFGLLGAILLILTLFLSLSLGRRLSTPLLQLRLWLRAPDPQVPCIEQMDEIGDLARQLGQRLAPPAPPAEEPEEPAEELFEGLENLLDERQPSAPARPAAPHAARRAALDDDEAELDAAALGLDDDDELLAAPAASLPVVHSAVLVVQLGRQEELQRRLPPPRLLELLQRYRDGLEQAARLYHANLLRLSDGSSLLLLHSNQSGEDYLNRALCCGELLRALGHALQLEVADCGLTVQLQLSLSQGEGLYGLPAGELLQQDACLSALALNRHSRNLLLLDPSLGSDPGMSARARIRPLATPPGASCIEQLREPLAARLAPQLEQLLQHG